MSQMRIKPSNVTFKIRKPNGEYLKPSGESVKNEKFWRKPLRNKEVEFVKEKKTPVKKEQIK